MRRVPQPHHGQRPRGLRADGTDHSHLGRAMDSGLTQDEASEALTQLALLLRLADCVLRAARLQGRLRGPAALNAGRRPPRKETLMRATLMYGAGDVRVETSPTPAVEQPTDALVRITASCVCGSDLHPYLDVARRGPTDGSRVHRRGRGARLRGHDAQQGRPGHRAVRVVRRHLRFCRDGLQTSCAPRRLLGRRPRRGGQAEALRVPLADGTLVKLPGRTPTRRSCRPC